MRSSSRLNQRTIYVLLQVLVIAALALAAVACGGDDDDAGSGDRTPPADPTQPAAPTQPSGDGGNATETGAGTVTIGDTTWTVEPDQQCSVYPGPVVAISGRAAEDPRVEITIDYDEAAGPNAVWLRDVETSAVWSAEGDQVSFDIAGNTVRGTGTFYNWTTGETADGSFDVRC